MCQVKGCEIKDSTVECDLGTKFFTDYPPYPLNLFIFFLLTML